MKNHIFLSLQPNWFFCMTWTILIICFKLPTATTCLSFYPSLHTKCLDPILQCRIYTNNHTNTFERKEKLFSRSRISNLELFVRHALHEPAPASKPLRPQFRQQEIKLLPPSFAKKIEAKPIKLVCPFGCRLRWSEYIKIGKCKSTGQILNHVTALISEKFLESWLNDSSCAKSGKRFFTESGGSFGTL